MNYELVDRYIYAATKRMPKKQREDVAQELHGLVDDMLTERCGEATPTEKDIRVVLTELGTPQELYDKYDENAKKCFIGQPYYSTYKFVLKIVLLAAAGGMTMASLMQQMIEPQAWGEALLSWLGSIYSCLLAAFAIVTLLFAFFYHKDIRITEPFNFDDLPPVPKRKQEISKWESILGIVICVIFTVIFLFVPEILNFAVWIDGACVQFFNPAALRETWYIIIGFSACGIIREVVCLLEGRYNKRVLTVTLVTNALSAALSIWWLAGFDLLYPDFTSTVATSLADESGILINMFSQFQYFFLALLLIVLIADTVETVVKTLRE